MSTQYRLAPWFTVLLWALVFGVAYSQYPLFYHTQNQYFFQGLMRTGFGLLKSDWFARTPDPWPAFTALVVATYRYLDPRMFYLYFVALLGVYAFSMIGIVSVLFRLDRSRLQSLVFVAILTALHSPAFGYLSRLILGLPLAESSPHHFNVGRILLLEGVGEKRILGDMLNPATFGVFLLLSIYLFLRSRPFLAVAASVLAALFQPSYILPAGILTASYMAIMVHRGEGPRRAIGLGVYALALILPLLIYTGIFFRPTDPAIWRESQDLLVRLAYYPPLIPALWMGATVYLKMAMVLGALYLVRRTDLFWIMVVSFAAATGLTVVQMLTGNTALALLIPWRISAYLVPLSTMILIGYGLAELLDRPERPLAVSPRALAAASVALLVVVVGVGIVETKWRFEAAGEARMPGVMKFVKAAKAPGQTYLIPPNWRGFRLFTGAPVFAERSVIPYDDVGVMEWYKRLRLADAFYGTPDEDTDYRTLLERRRQAQSASTPPAATRTEPSPEERCRMLKALSAGYRVTHVILEKGDLDGCSGWTVAYTDGPYRLYTVTP